MVTFNNAGRMGNWLFEAATAIAYALRHGLDFTVPSHTNDPYWNPLYCRHLIKNMDRSLPEIRLYENGHDYQELPYDPSWADKNIIIEGYRQSEKYFKEYRDEILYLFDFPWEIKEGLVGVHVRRGDYLQLPMKHPPVSKQWYMAAMAKFPNYKFKFFSDDIAWCRQEFSQFENCEFSGNTTEQDDMIELSCCEHQIISASTFGWWGAWLNKNTAKKIIIPELWFQPGWGGLETKDIVPQEWIKLPAV